MTEMIVLSLSILLQLAAAVMAFRLVPLTGRRMVWGLIATALLLMALRRLIPLVHMLSGDKAFRPDLQAELIALLISALLVIGISRIAPIFAERNRAENQLRESESRLKSISNNLPSVMIYQIVSREDKPREFTYLSDSVRQLYGVSPEEAFADPMLIYGRVHEADVAAVAEAEKEAWRTLSTFRVEARVREPSGRIRWSAFASTPTLRDDGSVCWDGIELVITGRKEAEQEALKQRQEVEQIINSMIAQIWYLDGEGRVVNCNAVAEKVSGVPMAMARGKTIHELAPTWDDPDRRHRESLEVVRTKKALLDSVESYRDGGDVKWVTVDKIPWLNMEGNVIGVLTFIYDITERIRMERSAENAASEWTATFDAMKDSVCLLDADATILRCNRAFTQLIGKTYEEVIGGQCCQLLHGSLDFKAQCPFCRMLTSQKREETETLINGRWFCIVVDPMYDTGGQLKGAVHVISDITQRKKTEEVILQTEKKYRSLFINAQEGIYQTTPEGGLIMANPAMAKIYGYSSPMEMMLTVKNAASTLYYNPEDRKEFLRRMQEDGVVHDFEVLHRKKDGTPVWIMSNAHPLYDKNSRLLCYEGTVIDISERKRAENSLIKKHNELEAAHEELKQAQARVVQQEKMASIGQLATGITHEINNPMSFITGNLGILDTYLRSISEAMAAQEEIGRKCLPPEAWQAIEDLKRKKKIDYILEDIRSLVGQSLEGAERVKKIVADLKTFSRMEDDFHMIEDVNAGLESTINIVWNEIKYKGELVRDFGDLPLTRCNISQINQVFMNLLVNAAQAIEKWGRITVKSWSDEDSIYVSVADTGSGIAEENRRRIFDPFFTTKPAGKGTGLGLSISSDIVRKHGGEITLESEPGKGTTFTVRIPVVNE